MIQNLNRLSSILGNYLEDEYLQRRITCMFMVLPVLNLLILCFTPNTNFFRLNMMVPVSTVIESFLFLTYVQITSFGYQRINQCLKTGGLDLATIKKITDMDHCLKDFIGTINSAFGPHIYLYAAMMGLSILCLETYIIDNATDNSTRFQLIFHCVCFCAYFIFIAYQCNIVSSEVR